MLTQNKKCSSKNNSYLLKREKCSESHLLLERENHLLQVLMFLEKKAGYLIPTMNCYQRNG